MAAPRLDNVFRQQGIRQPERYRNSRNIHNSMTHLAAYWLTQFRRKTLDCPPRKATKGVGAVVHLARQAGHEILAPRPMRIRLLGIRGPD